MSRNPITFNNGSSIPNTIQKGNVAIGIGGDFYEANYSGYKWWSGVNNPNGFIIYSDTYSQGFTALEEGRPTAWITVGTTESELLQTINKLQEMFGQTKHSTLADAITWLKGTGRYILVNRIYPSIVTSGLVMNLDSGFLDSYPLVGSTWYDFSNNSNNGTLVNSPTFSVDANDGGLLDFDGTNDHVSISDFSGGALTNFTVNAWFKLDSIPSTNVIPQIITERYVDASNINFVLGFCASPWDGKITGGFFTSADGFKVPTGFTPSANVWYNASVTYDGTTVSLYRNGTQESTLTTSVTPLSSGLGYYIARRWDDLETIDGKIPIVQVYNRALTSTEILQNYNAIAPRFGWRFSTDTIAFPSSITGYTLYSGTFTSSDDGNSSTAITIPTFASNGVSSTNLYLSTNGYITLNAGSGAINSTPMPASGSASATIAGNSADLWLAKGLVNTDGDTQNWYYKIDNQGSKYSIKNIVYCGRFGNTTSPRTYVLNLYRDSQYQYVETRVKTTGEGTVGPYNVPSVAQAASTTSRVWRGDLNGQNWTYLGTGSVI